MGYQPSYEAPFSVPTAFWHSMPLPDASMLYTTEAFVA